MRYVKAMGVGLFSAIVATVLSVVVVAVVESLYWQLVVLPRIQRDSEGSFGGGTFVSINVAPILAVALVAFVAGAWWMLRRTTRA